MPLEESKANADRYIRMMKSSRKADGVKEIFMPGEIEYRKFAETKKTGVTFSEALMDEITSLAIDLGSAPLGTTFDELIARFHSECS